MTNNTNDANYLSHYGVLGMRWGVRHDKEYKEKEKSLRKAYKLRNKRLNIGDDRYYQQRKASKQRYKNDIAKAKLATANRLYSKNTSAMNNRIVNRSTKGTALNSFLLGSYGAMKYDKYKADNQSTARAAVKAVLWNAANNATMWIPSWMEYFDNRGARKN